MVVPSNWKRHRGPCCCWILAHVGQKTPLGQTAINLYGILALIAVEETFYDDAGAAFHFERIAVFALIQHLPAHSQRFETVGD